MFVHQTHLEPRLAPEHYFSETQWQLERERIFLDSWQFVAIADQLAKPGSYVATDIAGVPVVVRNFDGQLAAFRNVCAHRHAQIVATGCGLSPSLKCGYHGWEYGERGQLTRLPDGKSFRGIRSDEICLDRFVVARVGPLVMVHLGRNPPDPQLQFGPLLGEIERFYGNHEVVAMTSARHEVNWKIIVENAVESYHVPMVHTNTFRDYLPESRHDHALSTHYTRYADTQPWDIKGGLTNLAMRWLTALTVCNARFDNFVHVHAYPNLLLYHTELIATLQVVHPVSATATDYTVFFMRPKSLRLPLISRLLRGAATPMLMSRLKRILSEDLQIWRRVQSGVRHSRHRGVLGVREERVHAFQNYVASFESSASPTGLTAISH